MLSLATAMTVHANQLSDHEHRDNVTDVIGGSAGRYALRIVQTVLRNLSKTERLSVERAGETAL